VPVGIPLFELRKGCSQHHMLLIAIFARRSPEKKILACIVACQTHTIISVDRDDLRDDMGNLITPNPQIDPGSLAAGVAPASSSTGVQGAIDDLVSRPPSRRGRRALEDQ